MKPSGVEWLGEVPEHWDVLPFRAVATVREGQVDPTDSRFVRKILIAPNHIESGTGRILLLETAEEQQATSGKYPVRAGEVVYSKIRPALNKACIAPEDCLCSADMYPMKVGFRTAPRFILYLLLSDCFVHLMVNESMRVAMPKVNRETLNEVRVAIPQIDEQCAIADHVDRENEKIDALIKKTRQSNTLMRERRTALISAAVTGKIDVRETESVTYA